MTMDSNLDGLVGTPEREPAHRGGLAVTRDRGPRTRRLRGLADSDRSRLHHIIRGTVATMTAEKLSDRPEPDFDREPAYDGALAAFLHLLRGPGGRVARLADFLETELPAGRPAFMQVLFLEAAARRLGREWLADTCSFVEVSIACARLQDLTATLARAFVPQRTIEPSPVVLVLRPDGEQHTLMPALLGLLFTTLGWRALALASHEVTAPAFRSHVAAATIACISWSNGRLEREVEALVERVRSATEGRTLPLLAGGPAALQHINRLGHLGIDYTADTLYAAAKICETYYALDKISRPPGDLDTKLMLPREFGWPEP